VYVLGGNMGGPRVCIGGYWARGAYVFGVVTGGRRVCFGLFREGPMFVLWGLERDSCMYWVVS
jgi:hypothetical protein